MKKLLLTLVAGSFLFITSCGDDDSDGGTSVGLSGTLTYDGETYAIANGILTLGQEEDNAVGQFFMADGTLESTSSNQVSTSDSQIIISIVATSRGTATLGNGDYATSTDVPDKYADVQVTTTDGQRQAFANGIVSITGSGNTYTIEFDVPFGQGVTLTGTVSGTYENP